MNNHLSLWIARNKEGDLWLFGQKPHMGCEDVPCRDVWCGGNIAFYKYSTRMYGCKLRLDDSMFPEVTFDNSPKELIINNKTLK